jgi:hypothetical protein
MVDVNTEKNDVSDYLVCSIWNGSERRETAWCVATRQTGLIEDNESVSGCQQRQQEDNNLYGHHHRREGGV